MKVVVIGGSGLIGSKVVDNLSVLGHEVVAASPQTGIDTITGEGLAEAVAGASVVVDLSNSPSFEENDVLAFFQTSTRNLLAAETSAGVGHHVAVSIVGCDRLPDSAYLRAKVSQERLIEQGGVPYTIVRSTQFFEFLTRIAQASADGESVHLSPALIQPIAADDVAAAVSDVALDAPCNGMVEVGGPEQLSLADVVCRAMRATGDEREVVTDAAARYFGALLEERSLVAGEGARLGATRFEDWLAIGAVPR